MEEIFNVSVVSHYTVDKLLLLRKFVGDIYSGSLCIPVDCAQRSVEIEPGGIKIRLCVWSLPSNYNFSDNKVSYKLSHGIIILFDLSNMVSFEHIPVLHNNIKRCGVVNNTVLLVGNRCYHSQPVVTQRQIKNLCSSLNLRYYEICIDDNYGIDTLFNNVCHEITKHAASNKNKNKNYHEKYKHKHSVNHSEKNNRRCVIM